MLLCVSKVVTSVRMVYLSIYLTPVLRPGALVHTTMHRWHMLEQATLSPNIEFSLDLHCVSHAHVIPRMAWLDTPYASRAKDGMVGHSLC